MAGWHHQLNGLELEQTPGDGGGQGSLACCSPWGHKESDTTEQLNNKAIATTYCSPGQMQIVGNSNSIWFLLYDVGLSNLASLSLCLSRGQNGKIGHDSEGSGLSK